MYPAIAASLILALLGTVHFYWAAGGTVGKNAAIPSRNGKPIMMPGALLTGMVGVALFGLAAFVFATGIGSSSSPVETFLRIGTGVIGLIFAARAIGDFRYVGFFKKVTDSAFARRDTYAYSPLCVLLAVLIGAVSMCNPIIK